MKVQKNDTAKRWSC